MNAKNESNQTMTEKQREALNNLDAAITQFDVGASIADDDVGLWNSVIKASKELRRLLDASKG